MDYKEYKEQFLTAYKGVLEWCGEDVKEVTKAILLIQEIPNEFLGMIAGFMMGSGKVVPSDDVYSREILLNILQEFYIATYGG